MSDPVQLKPGDSLDVCRCGDFRHQHANGTGRCELGEGCFPARCQQFQLFQTADQYAAEYPEHHKMMRELGHA